MPFPKGHVSPKVQSQEWRLMGDSAEASLLLLYHSLASIERQTHVLPCHSSSGCAISNVHLK